MDTVKFIFVVTFSVSAAVIIILLVVDTIITMLRRRRLREVERLTGYRDDVLAAPRSKRRNTRVQPPIPGWPPMVKPLPPPPSLASEGMEQGALQDYIERRRAIDEVTYIPIFTSSADPGPAPSPEPEHQKFTGFRGGESGGAGASGSWDSGSSSSDSGSSSSSDSGSSGGSSD